MHADDVVARLEEAGRTLLSLPPDRAQGHVRPRTWDALAPGVGQFRDALTAPLRCAPEPAAIDRMDEAFTWLPLIPDDRYVLRRIVAARLLVSPLTGRHLFPWRRLGLLLGADHKAVQRWHAQGIDLIVAALAAQTRRPAALPVPEPSFLG